MKKSPRSLLPIRRSGRSPRDATGRIWGRKASRRRALGFWDASPLPPGAGVGGGGTPSDSSAPPPPCPSSSAHSSRLASSGSPSFRSSSPPFAATIRPPPAAAPTARAHGPSAFTTGRAPSLSHPSNWIIGAMGTARRGRSRIRCLLAHPPLMQVIQAISLPTRFSIFRTIPSICSSRQKVPA